MSTIEILIWIASNEGRIAKQAQAMVGEDSIAWLSQSSTNRNFHNAFTYEGG